MSVNLVRRISNHSLVLRMLESPEGQEFLKAVQEAGIEMLQRIRKEDNEKDIFRLQGKLEVVSAISDLKTEIKQHLEKK